MLAHRLRHWTNISPVSGYCAVLAPRWMWASITDGGLTLIQLWFKAACWNRQHEVPPRAEWILASTVDAFNWHWAVPACTRRQHYQARVLLNAAADKPHCLSHIGVVPKRNNKLYLIHGLYCPQEPFNNNNFKSHWHLLAINLYGYAAGGVIPPVLCLQKNWPF